MSRCAPVAMLKEFDIVGESMMCEDMSQRVRNATVKANVTAEEKAELEQSGSKSAQKSWTKSGVQVLILHRRDYEKLVRSGVISSQVQTAVRSVGAARLVDNRERMIAAQTLPKLQRQGMDCEGDLKRFGLPKTLLTATSIRKWNECQSKE